MVRPRNVNKRKKKAASVPEWEQETEFASRTQIKQAAQAVNELGERLAQMKPDELARFELSDEVREAVTLLRRLKGKGSAWRRQKAYVGKLLRQDEPQLAHIRATLEQMALEGKQAQRRIRQCEQWRERLLEEGDAALADLLAQFPTADRPRLRQLIRNARSDQAERAQKARKELFQVLKALHETQEYG